MSTTAPRESAQGTRVLENFVGGKWVPSTSSELLDVTNPATGATLARVPLSNSEDVETAIAAARDALPGWRSTSVIKRAQRLLEMRQVLVDNQQLIAETVTTEMGKTLPDAYAEVGRAIEMLEAAAGLPSTMQGRILEDVATNIDAKTIRQPVGVVGIIAPFNFPAMVPFWFLPFALGTGNTVVLKPSEQVPLTQELILKLILERVELPAGVLNLVNGAHDVVNGLLESSGVDAISFVGSAKVAKYVYKRAAEHGKRVQALGGAKNFMVVMPDAVIEKTVENLLGSAFGAAGQRCMAGSVVVTVGDAHERLMPALKAATEALTVGDGMDKATAVGPVISCASRDRIVGWIEKGIADGASVVVDGRSPKADPNGAFVGPTILGDVTPDMEIAHEEVFGPVLAVIQADTLEEAIRIVNSSRYGNGTSIFTESGAAVKRYEHDVQVGMIGVNIGVAAPVAFFPFSGWKDSFFGDLHAHGPDAIEFYTRKKTVTTRFFSGGKSGKFFVESN